MKRIDDSELILNDDGSIYHLHLKPGQISDKIILVGDPGRVPAISSFFTKIELKVQNREFITHTGYYDNKRISVVSTGIGTGNIDIVLNELDAISNIDLEKRVIKNELTTLNIIRIGTSGGLQNDINVDSFLVSEKAIGFDGVLNFYAGRNQVCDIEFENNLTRHLEWNQLHPSPYVVNCSEKLASKVAFDIKSGCTISSPGFYGPQGRVLRLSIDDYLLNSKIESFNYKNHKITNYEMECSAIYGLSSLLNHNALTICVIIANRVTGTFSKDYQPALKDLIKLVLERY
jgi:uridine phosphorylase